VWEQIADRLRAVPGVEKASVASWALLSANSTNSFISIDSAPPGPILAYFLRVSPGWLDTVKLPLVAGRDFRDGDTTPGEAIVNETFVRSFYDGRNPIGRTFRRGGDPYVIVGITRDAPYRSLREPIFPVAYTPFRAVSKSGGLRAEGGAAFMIRTSSADPTAMESTVRREINNARADFRIHDISTEQSLIDRNSIRERLFALLSLFFASVALLLAGVGLYGVLGYSVLQRRREIGIRVAIGAQAADIARRITSEVFAMTAAGAMAGIALGLLSARSLDTLLYQVNASSVSMLALPAVTIFAGALLAALPAVVRALRIDPAQMLRAE
jgi:ABC-type antimicrobial peptide transport system permease subunit